MRGGFKIGKAIIGSIIAIIFAYIIFQAINALQTNIKTVRAGIDTYTVSIDGVALLVRDEILLADTSTDNYTLNLNEGEKLSVGECYATLYSSNQAYTAYDKYVDAETHYNILTGIYSSVNEIYDIGVLNTRISSLLNEIANKSKLEANSVLEQKRTELVRLVLTRRYALSGEDKLSSEISYYKMLMDSYNSSSDGNDEKRSSVSGYYSAYVDGYEESLTSSGVENYSADYIDYIISNPTVYTERYSNCLGKVITDFRWYFLMVVDGDEAELLTEGKSYNVAINGVEVNAVLSKLHEDEKREGEYVLLFSSSDSINDFTSVRISNARIIIEEHTGYRVPRDALRVVEGETGVFCLQGYRAVFVNVEVITSTDTYYIVEADFTSEDGLFSNDYIIINTKGLYDGKVISNSPIE